MKKKNEKYQQKTLGKELQWRYSDGGGGDGKFMRLVVLIIKNQKDFNENNSL